MIEKKTIELVPYNQTKLIALMKQMSEEGWINVGGEPITVIQTTVIGVRRTFEREVPDITKKIGGDEDESCVVERRQCDM